MKISVEINNEKVELTEFPTKIIINVLLGMLQSLHGVDEVQTAVVRLEAEE